MPCAPLQTHLKELEAPDTRQETLDALEDAMANAEDWDGLVQALRSR
jgi:hypothetical protein